MIGQVSARGRVALLEAWNPDYRESLDSPQTSIWLWMTNNWVQKQRSRHGGPGSSDYRGCWFPGGGGACTIDHCTIELWETLALPPSGCHHHSPLQASTFTFTAQGEHFWEGGKSPFQASTFTLTRGKYFWEGGNTFTSARRYFSFQNSKIWYKWKRKSWT